MKTPTLLVLLFMPALLAAQSRTRPSYPKTRQVDQVDDYYGTQVRDPYRWLEDDAQTRERRSGWRPRTRSPSTTWRPSPSASASRSG